MIPFTYERANSPEAAIHAGEKPGAKYLGGGSNLIDLMKNSVELPTALIDVNHAGMDQVEASAQGARIGASVRNSDMANHPGIVAHYPLASFAILSGALTAMAETPTFYSQ